MARLSTPITVNQTIRAFRRLSADDADWVMKGAQRLQEKTGLKLSECLQVFASLGVYMVRHGEDS